MIIFGGGGRLDQASASVAAGKVLDEEAYVSSLKDQALTQVGWGCVMSSREGPSLMRSLDSIDCFLNC